MIVMIVNSASLSNELSGPYKQIKIGDLQPVLHTFVVDGDISDFAHTLVAAPVCVRYLKAVYYIWLSHLCWYGCGGL